MQMSMASYIEIETDDFKRALQLLHSRTPESSDELKKLLDSYNARQVNNEAKKSKDFSNVLSALQSLNQDVKNEADRRVHTKASEDDSEATDIEDNDNGDSVEFANDLASLACVVCKQIEITTNNQLFECQDCNSLYHQECHKPPITKKDINDPRLVWYCSKCSKNVKKLSKTMPTNKSGPTISKIGGGGGGGGGSLNISSTSNITVSSATSGNGFSLGYQSASQKDILAQIKSSNFLKSSDGGEKSAGGIKRAAGGSKFSAFSTYSPNTKSTLSALNRASASASSLSANKSKGTSSSSSSSNNSASSFSSINALPNLDKRFPNLKKAKQMGKFN